MNQTGGSPHPALQSMVSSASGRSPNLLCEWKRPRSARVFRPPRHSLAGLAVRPRQFAQEVESFIDLHDLHPADSAAAIAFLEQHQFVEVG